MTAAHEIEIDPDVLFAAQRRAHYAKLPELDHRAVSVRGILRHGHRGAPGDRMCHRCAAVEADLKAEIARERELEAAKPKPRAPTPAEVAHKTRTRFKARGRITVRETILLAASRVASVHPEHLVEFDRLVVAAWSIDRERLGLGSLWELHPHAGRVQAKLSGREGLVSLAHLLPIAPLTWKLTPEGARRARALESVYGRKL
jgi:hypothetical protein